jgi:hypothetical protein
MESVGRLRKNEGDVRMPIICDGCGQKVPIPEGYRRNKIQCACGVIVVVPEAARKEAEEAAPARTSKKPAPKTTPAEEEDVRWLLDDDPPAAKPSERPRFREPEPVEKPTTPAKKVVSELQFKCRRCGRRVRRQGECPDCDKDQMPAPTPEPFWPSVDEAAAKQDEEDSSPYLVEGADDVKCPKCTMMLPPGSVLCVRCGYHFKKRKKIAKTYEPIQREWETNATLQKRLKVFGICVAIILVTGLIGVFMEEVSFTVFLGSLLGASAMLAFLLGTYDRILLTRTERGRVQVTKTWRVCFMENQPTTVDAHGYEGISSGQHRTVTSWDFLIFCLLLVSGIIPGIIWYYFVFHKITYQVSFSQNHGFPAYLVYSGSSETQMQEIAYALRDATGMRYEAG